MRLLLAALSVLLCAAFAPSSRVEYTLAPVMRDGALQAIAIDFIFRGDADGDGDPEGVPGPANPSCGAALKA